MIDHKSAVEAIVNSIADAFHKFLPDMATGGDLKIIIASAYLDAIWFYMDNGEFIGIDTTSPIKPSLRLAHSIIKEMNDRLSSLTLTMEKNNE